MDTSRALLAEGLNLHRGGQLHEAELRYRAALDVDPTLADAWHLLGLIAHQSGRSSSATGLIAQALALAPGHPTYLVNQASVLSDQGDNQAAILLFEQALPQQSEQPKAWYNYGNALRSVGRQDDAENAYRRALGLDPHYAEAHTNLGVLLRARGRVTEALEHYRAAVAAKPDFAPALFNLGNALQALSTAAPTESLVLYDRAESLRPDFSGAPSSRGAPLKQVGRLDEAVQAYLAALDNNPNSVETVSNLAIAYQDLGLVDKALSTIERALQLKPDFSEVHSNALFIANYLPQITPAELRSRHEAWTRAQTSHIVRRTINPRNADPTRSLRIGFVSPDWHTHPVTRFIAAWFEHHDRRSFETFVYACSDRQDHWTDWLRERAACWRSVAQLECRELADLIVGDQIDILVDLAGHTSHHRLNVFAARCAPLQMTYLGYPNTTGLDTIDYLITDSYVDPPGFESHFTERLWRIDPCFSCFYPPEQSPEISALPAGASGPITFGGLHNLAKLNSAVLELWTALMRRVPESRLLLFRDTLCGSARERLTYEFVSRGIEVERLDFQWEKPNGYHLPIYDRIDIALDVFPWSGHTTACEALWMGVPVVTRVTDRHAGRMVGSVLHTLGRDDWIAESDEQYLAIAARLATDRVQLAHLRRTLRDEFRLSPLCDTFSFTHRLETVFRQAWQLQIATLSTGNESECQSDS